jgi:hypothetical protein
VATKSGCYRPSISACNSIGNGNAWMHSLTLLYHAVVAFDVLTWLINVGGLFRYTPSMPCRKLFEDVEEYQCFESNHICYDEHGDACSCSNFLDMDWLSTSGNSCEEDLCDR